MSNDNYQETHIIGCGNVGSKLAIELTKLQLVDKLFLYDWDIVNSVQENSSYPFSDCFGIKKVDAVKLCCNMINPNVNVITNANKIISIDTQGLVIDCRDKKSWIINCDFSISMDGFILIIDSINSKKNYDFSRYCLPKNEIFSSIATSIIVMYIANKMYKIKQKILFDLEEIIQSYNILEG